MVDEIVLEIIWYYLEDEPDSPGWSQWTSFVLIVALSCSAPASSSLSNSSAWSVQNKGISRVFFFNVKLVKFLLLGPTAFWCFRHCLTGHGGHAFVIQFSDVCNFSQDTEDIFSKITLFIDAYARYYGAWVSHHSFGESTNFTISITGTSLSKLHQEVLWSSDAHLSPTKRKVHVLAALQLLLLCSSGKKVIELHIWFLYR